MSETPWYEGPLASLDFETTGVDPSECRPVSVALCCAQVDGTEEAGFSYTEIINCGEEVPEGAAKIHGLTTDVVRAKGRDPLAVLVAVRDRLTDCATFGIPVVIMNAPFDWTLLHAEAERHGLDMPCKPVLVDPKVIDLEFDQYRRGQRRLSDMCLTYGIPPLTEAHDALADAKAAIAVTRAIARKYLSSVPLSDLMELQVEWYANFRARRNDYWSSIRDPRRVEPGWPLRITEDGVGPCGELTHDSPKQLPKTECAQKELNLQPAVTNEVASGRVLAFPPVANGAGTVITTPTEAESGSAKRNRNVTESEHFSAPGHKPFALAHRPEIFGFLEGITLAAAMGGGRVWK